MSVGTASLARGGSRTRLVRSALLALALGYVAFLLLLPIAGIVWGVVRGGASEVASTFSDPAVRHAFWLTGVITAITVVVAGFFGVVAAWVFTRDRFPGRQALSAVVDLPLAVSPVIVGLMAVILFGRGGWFEPFFAARGIQVIFALPSMVLVTIFICIPFVIREVAPVLEEIGTAEEEAAHTLGASSLQSFFRVTLPSIRWALLYGIALTTARALGEIGAVLIVSGALRGLTETATLYILLALEERQEASAYVVALTLAAVSVTLLLTIEFIKRKHEKERAR
jgi:sulfate/thiosulfate transport system permease protein